MATKTSDDQWTIETLKDHLITMIQANDKRYMDRFDQSEKSVSTAMTAADKAVSAALIASEKAVAAAFAANKEAVAAAFVSSKEAVTKAEENQRALNAANNEFRGQLSDQADTLQTIANAKISNDAFTAKTAEMTKVQDLANNKITVLEGNIAILSGIERRIDDITKVNESLSNRITTIESTKIGATENKSNTNTIYIAIIIGLTLVIGIIELISHMK
jgi:hypothetical protein